jgi:hypothetical protein
MQYSDKMLGVHDADDMSRGDVQGAYEAIAMMMYDDVVSTIKDKLNQGYDLEDL